MIHEFLQPVQESAYFFRLFYLLRTFSSLTFFYFPPSSCSQFKPFLNSYFFIYSMSLCLEFSSPDSAAECIVLVDSSVQFLQPPPIISSSSILLLFLPLLFDLLISSVFLTHCFQLLSKNEEISCFSIFFLWSYYWKYLSQLLQRSVDASLS